MTRVPPAVVVVFDEAYYEFVDRMPDTLRYVRDGRNVVTLRTFRKFMDWRVCALAMASPRRN